MNQTTSIVVPAIQAPLESVAVYRNAAELKRNVSVQVDEAGEYHVEFQLLQQNIRQDSVRVELTGAGVTIIEVQTGYGQVSKKAVIDQNPDVKVWYEEFKEILNKKVTLLEKKRLREQRHSALDNLLISVTGQRSGVLANLTKLDEAEYTGVMEGVLGLSLMVEQHSAKGAAELLAMGDELSEMDEMLEALADKIRQHAGVLVPSNPNQEPSNQLGEMRQAICDPRSTPPRPYIRVHMSVEAPVKITGNVSYITDGCYWHPRYDLKMRSEDLSRVEMSYLAHVTQDSKEDWINVKMALHTGEPSAQGEPPALPPLIAEFQKPGPPPVRPLMMGRASAAPELAAYDAAIGVNALPQARFKKAMLRTGGIANEGQAVFDLPGSFSIPSDNESHRFVITEQTFKTSTIFYCTPEVSCDVFRAGSCENNSEFLFMAGPVSVFWDGAMVASTNLNNVNPGEIFHTFFGKEQLVKLDILPQKQYRKTTGWKVAGQSDMKLVERTVRVNNHRKQSLNVMAIFRLPRSTDSEIKITLNSSIKAQSVEYDSDLEIAGDAVYESLDTAADGTLLWVENKATNRVAALARLAPNGKVAVAFAYTTESPQGKELIIH